MVQPPLSVIAVQSALPFPADDFLFLTCRLIVRSADGNFGSLRFNPQNLGVRFFPNSEVTPRMVKKGEGKDRDSLATRPKVIRTRVESLSDLNRKAIPRSLPKRGSCLGVDRRNIMAAYSHGREERIGKKKARNTSL